MSSEAVENPVLEQLLEVVDKELAERYGSEGYYRWGERAFMRMEGDVVLFLVASPLEDNALFNVRSYLVRDVEKPDAELGNFLARLNADQLFGAFSIDEDADVCFDYSVLGSAVTAEVIRLALDVVAQAADRYTATIIERWGGVTSLEKLRQELEHMDEPASDEDPAPN